MTNMKFVILLFVFATMIGCQSEKKGQASPSPKAKQESSLPISSLAPSKTKAMKNLDLSYCMGKFEPSSHEDFVAIPLKYADREGMYMRKDAYSAFEDMFSAAYEEGVKFQIRSAARNFTYQKGIWERKWTGATKLSDGTDVSKDISQPIDKALKILEYSSMPGTSRHHWGTDIDLNTFNNEYFEKGEGKKMYDWLLNNASKYGFCQPYTAKGKDRPEGYNEEKWHWSYQPISQSITDFAESNLKNKIIEGFLGAETAEEIDVVRKYVLGINSGCRH